MQILVAEDHQLVREAVAALLSRPPLEASVIEAEDFAACLQAVLDTPDLDLCILDLYLPGTTPRKSLSRLRSSAPTLPVIVLSASEASDDMSLAEEFGVMGYVPKSVSSPLLVDAIRMVMNGFRFMPNACGSAHRSSLAAPPAPGLDLSDRQREILTLIVEGASNKAIAQTLAISPSTVKTHLEVIFRRLGIRNRTEAASRALALGLGRQSSPDETGG